MAIYNDKVIDHFTNPHNVGEFENPDGEGTYGSPVCGDMMKISIMVEDGVITDARFKTFGCGSAIASSSVATDMIIGKTVEEALKVTNGDVLDELGGLPPIKIHCSVLADHAIKSAIYDYAQRHGKTYKGLEGFDPHADEEDTHHGCDMETAVDEMVAEVKAGRK
ncbi:MAG: iron-sulfur cluster assembly scaffold protein [Clostridiales Family XIII bacterium]|jgi:nitrogen fixation NifU-like protein|nr:iron-sulfur cluster assembly scaffold protein [Clostridiales Family XIII bacterium]